MVKRLLSSCIAVLMLVTAFSSFTALASTEVTVPSSLVNVSYGKTIADSKTSYSTASWTDASKVLDGTKNTAAGWIGTGTNYFVVDLGQAYKIDKVTIYERGDADGPYRGQFVISATNDDPTSESATWTEINNSNITSATSPSISEVFPARTSYSPTLKNNSTPFRYIKYAGKSTAYVSEFEVFSDVAATDNLYTSTKNINIAKHKPTTSSHPTSDYAKVVDDDFYTQGNVWHIGDSWYAANPDVTPSAPWVKIDLLRQYEIDKIVIYDRIDSPQASRGKFEIYGTNNPDATEAEWEKIFFATDDPALANDLDNAFPTRGNYVVPVTDKNYRYIIYKGANGNSVSVREVQVFANVKVSEVSRGATAIGSYPGTQNGGGNYANLTNGPAAGDFQSGNHASKYTFLTFDLGKKQKIDLFEITPTTSRQHSISLYYHNIGFYGSNTKINDYKETEYGETGKVYDELDAATFMTATSSTKLGEHSTYMDDTVYNIGDSQIYQQIWTYEAENVGAGTAYYIPFNNTQKYQYFTLRKESLQSRIGASDIAVYTIRPEAFGVTVANKKAYVNFSDYNMDSASINSANIKVYDAEGTDLELTPALSGTQAVIDIESLPAGNYKVAIGQGVMNTYGTTLAEGKIFDFKVRENKLAVTGFEAAPTIADNTATLSITASNGTTSPETLFAAVALYDGTKLIAISDVTPIPVAADSDVAVTRTATVPEAFRSKVVTAKAFCWYNGTLKPFTFE